MRVFYSDHACRETTRERRRGRKEHWTEHKPESKKNTLGAFLYWTIDFDNKARATV